MDLIVTFLAGMQLVELYRHGSLFGTYGALPIRPWAERHREQGGAVGYLAKLLGCPFCQAPWACALAASGWWWGGAIGKLIVFALAASRLANLLNDLAHSWSRSPLRDEDFAEVEVSESVD